ERNQRCLGSGGRWDAVVRRFNTVPLYRHSLRLNGSNLLASRLPIVSVLSPGQIVRRLRRYQMTSVAEHVAGPAPTQAAAAREVEAPATTRSATGARELRLDLFRGLALWLIFIDHLPPSLLTWFTIRNYGFSDATEIFIFISGYTAAFVYGRAMTESGFVVATARILRRTWQIYVAHVFLFTIFLAEISYVATSFENPLYTEEMGIMDFLRQPDVTIVQALLLRFRPVNMDVLPLY